MFNRKVSFDMIFLNKNRNKILTLTIVLVSFLVGGNAYALNSFTAGALDILSWITFQFVAVVGSLIGVFVSLFIKVISYNNFINEQPVLIGWEIIRDLCNMGFVLILLLIAVSSVLQIESYGYRNRLFKIAIMAVLINFSKMFTGVLIDLGQIIMLTFASGVTAIGGGNFMDVLGINQFLNMDISEELTAYKAKGGNSDDINGLNIMATIFLTLIVALIALVVVAAITIILVIRIVALWILIILSPAAYLLAFSPVASGYARQWWSKFSQWLVNGPVMIFFIWLSLSTLKSTMNTIFPAAANDPTVGFANIGTPAVMGAFLLAAIMLMASLVVAQQLGGIAGRVAGSAYSMITSRGEKMVRGAAKVAALPAVGAKALAGVGVDKLHRYSGVDLNVGRVWKGVMEQRKENKGKDYLYGTRKAAAVQEHGGAVHGIMALSGKPGEAWNYVANWKNFGTGYREKLLGGRRMNKKRQEYYGKLKAAEFENSFVEQDPEEQRKVLKALKSERLEVEGRLKDEKITNKDKADLEIKQANLNERIGFGEEKEKANFKANFAGMSKNEQKDKLTSLQEEREHIQQRISQEKDQEKISALRQEQQDVDERLKVADDLGNRNINSERAKLDETVKDEIGDYQKAYQNIIEGVTKKNTKDYIQGLKEGINKYSSAYSFDSSAAKDRLVREEISKISDITNSEQLTAMLSDAISGKDRVRVEALLKKMTRNGDSNEYLQSLGYRTDYVGLQDFMDDLSNKESGNYAGFSKEDAYTLGGDVSEIAKGVNHWDVHGGFKMENGQWRKTIAQEKIANTNNEMTKNHMQSMVRSNNRLAYGYYDENGKWNLSESGLVALKLMDHKRGWDEWEKNGQLNAVNFLVSEESTQKMRDAGISEDMIKSLLNRSGGVIKEKSGIDTNEILEEFERNRAINKERGESGKQQSSISPQQPQGPQRPSSSSQPAGSDNSAKNSGSSDNNQGKGGENQKETVGGDGVGGIITPGKGGGNSRRSRTVFGADGKPVDEKK